MESFHRLVPMVSQTLHDLKNYVTIFAEDIGVLQGHFLQIVFYLYLHGLVIFLFPNFVLQPLQFADQNLQFLLLTPSGESSGIDPMVFRRNVELLVAADVAAGDDYDDYDDDDDDDDVDDDDSDAGCAGDKTAAALAASTAAAAAALPAKISLIIKRERFGFIFDIFLCSSIAVVAVVKADLDALTTFTSTFEMKLSAPACFDVIKVSVSLTFSAS
uniref:Uncharacterized protein n=1 Tax=Glossina palpalis gambiensis TaxID=67801 RepID=A0A1B0B030_9MUSC